MRNKHCASIKGCGAEAIRIGVSCQHKSHDYRLIGRMSCAKKLCFSIRRMEIPGLEQTRPCSLSFPKKCDQRVASQYAETRLAAFRPERLVPLSHGHARGSDGSWAQPEMGKTTFFGAASSIQRDVAPTRDERYSRKPRPAFRSQLRCPKDVQQMMKAQSVNVSSPNPTLHTFRDTSTTAPMPCGTGQHSFQRSSCSSQASGNDLIT